MTGLWDIDSRIIHKRAGWLYVVIKSQVLLYLDKQDNSPVIWRYPAAKW